MFDIDFSDNLKASLERNGGRLGQVCSELGMTRAQLGLALDVCGLAGLADLQRAGGRVRGPRATLPDGSRPDDAEKRTAYRQALVKHEWDSDAARAEFGIARRTWYKELSRLGIVRPDDSAKRRRRLEGSLQKHHGVKLKVAADLNISRPTVDNWCAEFGIDPAKFKLCE